MKTFMTIIIGFVLLLMNCAGSNKQVATLDNPDYLIGEWIFVRYVYSPVGRYVQEQYEEIISTNLIITKDSVYFKNKIDFIENCGDFQWDFSTTDEFMRKELIDLGEDEDMLIKINSNCYEDLRPAYLKEDTLISFNGGIVTYRVKVTKNK